MPGWQRRLLRARGRALLRCRRRCHRDLAAASDSNQQDQRQRPSRQELSTAHGFPLIARHQQYTVKRIDGGPHIQVPDLVTLCH
jgi:hypothetical protein